MPARIKSKHMKKLLLSILALSFFTFSFVYAATVTDIKYSGNLITATIDGESLTFTEYERNIEGYKGYFADSSNYDSATQVGDFYILDVYNDNIFSARLHKLHADGTNSQYVSQNQLVTIAAGSRAVSVGGYRLFPTLSCQTSSQPLTCFTQAIFSWAQVAIIILAVGAIVFAGIIYMTSAGNPKRIEMSKKLIWGALTGVAVMILGRLFLTKVVGVAWPW